MKKIGLIALGVLAMGLSAFADSSTPVGVVEQAAGGIYNQNPAQFCQAFSASARGTYCNEATMYRIGMMLSGYEMSAQLAHTWAGPNHSKISLVNVYGVSIDQDMEMSYLTSIMVSCQPTQNGSQCSIDKLDRIQSSKP